MKKAKKIVIKGPNVKERKRFAPATKKEAPKKGKGSYERKETSVDEDEEDIILNFLDSLMKKNYVDAHKYINEALSLKLHSRISNELNTPLF